MEILTETSDGLRISKWGIRVMVSIALVILSGFTYLYGQDEKLKSDIHEELDKKAPVSMLIKLDENNAEAHDKLTDKLEEMEEQQIDTNLTVKRIETILEERYPR